MTKSIGKVLAVLMVVGLIATGGTAFAAEFAKVGTVGTKFLEIAVGARGAAMGNAFNAVSDDATAMFWNPAGLTNIDNTQVSVERIEWLADITYNAFAAARSLNNGMTVGIFAASLNSGDIEETTVAQPDGTGRMFNVTDILVGAAYAAKFTDKFSFGANAKFVREDLDGDIANAWAVDVGTLYDTHWRTVKLSMAIRNFGPEIQLDGGYHDYDNGQSLDDETPYLEYQFPMTFKLGASMSPVKDLLLAAELEHPNDNIERYNIGAEYGMMDMLFLRGGYTFNHNTLGMSAGLGVRLDVSGYNLGVDYAFSDYSVLEEVHRFNVNFTF